MFRQELPLMFPDDPDVAKVKAAFFDPFEYLMLRHKQGALKTDFKVPLGTVSYQAACHQRVQNMGRKTFEMLSLVPGTEVKIIERCAGHDGTYALKSEKRAAAVKIVKPVASRVTQDKADHFGSDCPMGGHHIENALGGKQKAEHPISLMRKAYGI
jgi:Fe-S oxidoreductase